MVLLCTLAGIYVLLCIPWLGKHLQHALLHPIVHSFHHHEDRVMLLCSFACWILIAAWLGALVTGAWWMLANITMLFLVLTKLFATFSTH